MQFAYLMHNCFSDRTSERWTSSKDFAVIGIQAYAERNQCKEAVTFASQVFRSSEGFPAKVLELWQVYIFSLLIYKINKVRTFIVVVVLFIPKRNSK